MNKQYTLYYVEEVGPNYFEKIIYDNYDNKEDAEEDAKELQERGIETIIEKESEE